MSSNYVAWFPGRVRNAVSLVDLDGYDDDWEFVKGVRLLENFPDNVSLKMNPDLPKDTILVDNLINTDLIVITSERLKTFLEGRNLESVEYLPITIFNHKKRPIDERYFIIHPVNPVDCMDLKKSVVEWSDIDDESIDEIDKLVLEESKVGNRDLFRLKYYFDIVLVKRALAEEITDAGFTGIRWKELDKV